MSGILNLQRLETEATEALQFGISVTSCDSQSCQAQD